MVENPEAWPTRLALRRLRDMTGHSSMASMIQLLRTAHASGLVLEVCWHFSCDSCRKTQAVQRPNVTKMPWIALKLVIQVETGVRFCLQFAWEPCTINAGGLQEVEWLRLQFVLKR